MEKEPGALLTILACLASPFILIAGAVIDAIENDND